MNGHLRRTLNWELRVLLQRREPIRWFCLHNITNSKLQHFTKVFNHAPVWRWNWLRQQLATHGKLWYWFDYSINISNIRVWTRPENKVVVWHKTEQRDLTDEPEYKKKNICHHQPQAVSMETERRSYLVPPVVGVISPLLPAAIELLLVAAPRGSSRRRPPTAGVLLVRRLLRLRGPIPTVSAAAVRLLLSGDNRTKSWLTTVINADVRRTSCVSGTGEEEENIPTNLSKLNNWLRQKTTFHFKCCALISLTRKLLLWKGLTLLR